MLIVDFLSAAVGRHSYFAKFANMVFSNLLNLVYAVVAVGYVSQLFAYFLTSASLSLTTTIAISLLLCAAPFEVMTSVAENSTSTTGLGLSESIASSYLYYFIALVFSFMGSVQFFIRNYVLMQNFARTSIGSNIYSYFGYQVSNIAVLGGVMGMASHFLLSYINWDQLGLIKNKYRDHYQEFAFPISLSVFSIAVLYSPIGQLFWTQALCVLTAYVSYQIAFFNKNSKKSIEKAGLKESSIWNTLLAVLLPLGASLYFIVDFMNGFMVLEQLGYLSMLSIGACVVLGAISYLQKIQMWGKNLCFKIYRDEGEYKLLSKTHPLTARLYYFLPYTRAITAVTRELLLVGLDVFNNMFSFAFINELAKSMLGCSISVYYLHICTIAAFLNRMVVLYFQAPLDETRIVAENLKPKKSKVHEDSPKTSNERVGQQRPGIRQNI
jgi:hypothetical protein